MKLHKKCDHNKLIDYGFKKYGSTYRYNLPLHNYKNKIVIECDFKVSLMDNYFEYEVVDNNTQELYIPYYNPEFSAIKHNLVRRKVIKKLNQELKKMKQSNIIKE